METIRKPAVAGLFYPADPQELAATVDGYLQAVPEPAEYSRVVVSPHAGYVYSGATAGYAHRNLDPTARRVIVLGPTHRVGIGGMALSGADWQETPLGTIKTDPEISRLLEAEFPRVVSAPVVHAAEHSIEVQLPFLQRHLKGDFTVVPVAVGHCPAPEVAEVFDRFWDWPDVAFVVSSDLSHYLPYRQAQEQDGATLQQILRGDPPLQAEQACGAFPVSGLMEFAQSRGLSGRVLQACNSGDTAGDRGRVVGYAALAWSPEDPPLPTLAYNAIAERLGAPTRTVPATSNLDDPGATFVTLTIGGKLRGCMGSLQTDRPLGENLAKNALAAAFRDPRFPPLTAAELAQVRIEVSRLTEPERVLPAPASEAEVCARLRPLVDGVIISHGRHRATFLPQVWEQIPDPCQFLRQLKRKAGLDPGFWDGNVVVETYQVDAESWGT